jgi:hypothetical protein
VHAGDSSLVCSRDRSEALVARTGVPLVDAYLEFLGGRCRPNTLRAAAYDLKVFFAVVARPAEQVRPAGVLGSSPPSAPARSPARTATCRCTPSSWP